MSDPRQFDPVRACFYLIAGIISVYALIVLMGVGWCLYYGKEMAEQKFQCDKDGKLSELLSAALAAALAFAGGFSRDKGPR